MCMLHIQVQCHDKYFEIISDELESAEITVEHAISHVLLDLFGEVSVDDVTLHFPCDRRMGLQQCTIHIQAQCASHALTVLPRTQEQIEQTIAQCICPILKELFGSVHVECVTLSPFSRASQQRLSLPS